MYVPADLAIEPLSPCAAATTLWRYRGRLCMTAVVKATYALAADATALVGEPVAIVDREQHFEASPSHSVEAPSDLAPFLPNVGLVVRGSAFAAGAAPVSSMSVRLAIVGDRTKLEKTLYVYGDSVPGAGRSSFSRMPLRYERAVAGGSEAQNPVGVQGAEAANLLDVHEAARPAGLGAIGWDWPARLHKLGNLDRGQLLSAIPAFPDDFDWSFFQPAPPDQQLPRIRGDEWLVLDGLSPRAPRLLTRLPRACAELRAVLLTSAGPSYGMPQQLALDTLLLDTDREQLCLIWRTACPLELAEEELSALGLWVGVRERDGAIEWPAQQEPGPLVDRLTPLARETVRAAEMLGEPILSMGVDDPIDATAPSATQKLTLPRPTIDGTASAPEEPSDEAAAPEPPPPPEARQRQGPDIPVVNTTPYHLVTISWQLRPPQDSLVVVVKGTFDLVHDGPATARDESDFPTGQLHHQDDPEASAIYPSDYAVLKPRADVLLLGHAHAPGGSATAMKVSLRFGHEGQRIDKTVTVQGDRAWRRRLGRTVPGDPAAFDRIPLVYERAFGGPSHDKNPWGRGHGDSPAMPNLEFLDELVLSPRDHHRPACFAPLPLQHAPRWKKLGTYGRRWLKTRWPYFAEDFDWSFYQDAPEDQQLDHLVGDEPYQIAGVHPTLGVFEGTLPCQQPRCFVVGQPDAGDALVEVELRLDTVVFDFDALTLQLVWRGVIDVSRDDAPEIGDLFLTEEPLDADPMTGEQVRQRYQAAIAPLELVAEPEDGEPANDVADSEPPTDEQDEQDALDAELAELERSLTAQVGPAALTDAAPTPPPPPPDPEAIAAALRDAGAPAEDVAELLEAMKPLDDEESPDDEPPVPPVRERVQAMLAQGESFDAFDFEEGDLSDLDFSGQSLHGARLQRGCFVRCRFDRATLAEAQIGEADLREASFVEADLTGADLTAAELQQARFDQAMVTNASFVDCRGAGTSFAGARGERTQFAGGSWDEASFEKLAIVRADFSRASLQQARFVEAQVPELTLYAARCTAAVFDGAHMAGARAESAVLRDASMNAIDAAGSVFDGATMDRARLVGADLRGASLSGAVCRQADLSQVDLTEAQLRRAQLQGAKLRRANLMMADLEGADLNIADLRDANLHSAGLWQANLQDAQLAGAILTKSTLVMRSP